MDEFRDRDSAPLRSAVLPWIGRLPRHALPMLAVLASAWLMESLARPVSAPRPPGAPAILVADRDRSRVYELDDELLLAGRREAGWPLQLAARSDGGLWMARSGNATPDFGARLDLVARDGTVRGQLWLEAHVDLAVAPDDAALCIEQSDPQTRRLLRVDDDVVPRALHADPHLARVRASREHVWCSTDDSRLLQLDPADGSVLRSATFPGGVHDVRPDGAGGVLVLAGAAPRRLVHLGPDLVEASSLALPGAPSTLAHEPRAGAGGGTPSQAWLLDPSTRALLRVALDAGGPPSIVDVPSPEPLRLLALPDGGVLVATPGALLRFDRYGQTLPGQGGFGWISSLALVGG